MTTAHLGITVRLIPAFYWWVPINITIGKASASITITRADIELPHPYEDGRITVECRSHIVEAVRSAIDKDGHDRRITWPQQPSPHQQKAAS